MSDTYSRPMKDSGIEWIGEIPAEWEIRKVKYVLKQDTYGIKIGPFGSTLTGKTSADGKYNVYSQANLIADDFSVTKNAISEKTFQSLSAYVVKSGDICLSMMGTIGKCKTVPEQIHEGIMDSHLIKLRLESVIDNRFFEYVYDKDLGGICYTQMQYDKKGTIMDGLNTQTVKSLRLPLPPIDIQRKIVFYLDSRCSQIDSMIASAKANIEDYKALKQSVITQAVTKGLDPDVEMKDSGVEWIGKIPMHWDVDKIKYHLTVCEEKGRPDLQVLSVYRDYGVIPKDSRDDNHNVTSEDTSKYKVVQPGYLVINKMKAWQGSMAISDYQGIVSPAYYIYRFTDEKLIARYLHYLLRTPIYAEEFRRLSAGIRDGQWDLSRSEFEFLRIVVPSQKEQQQIIRYIDSKSSGIDRLISEQQALIDDLEAAKKSLIYECVTGKRRVPDVKE